MTSRVSPDPGDGTVWRRVEHAAYVDSGERVVVVDLNHLDLPRNPLTLQGYPSIGCAPCTRKVAPGEDPRAGRWSGKDKTECGIHT